MPPADPKITRSRIVDRSSADSTCEFDHLRNKRIEAVGAPRRESSAGLGWELDGTQHDITEIQKPRAQEQCSRPCRREPAP